MDSNKLKDMGFSTRAIHSAQGPDPEYGALATPIYQTSTFCFEDIQAGMDTFAGEKTGHVYSRSSNPTRAILEGKIAALEGGAAAIATGSGMGAISSTLLTLLKSGDHIIYCNCIYGCTSVVIREGLVNFGIESTNLDTTDVDAVKAAILPNTKMIYFETPTNPLMEVTDITAMKEIAGDDILVVVDNTFAPPPIQTPLSCGADIVVHSVTKYLNGHGDVIGGLIIAKDADLIARINDKGVTKLTGAICSPFDSYLIIRGLQTLELRVRRHCENALAVAEFLESNDLVKNVRYPALKSSKYYDLYQKQMNGLGTGMLSFELKDGISGLSSFEAAKKFINALHIPHIAVSLGDPASLIQLPASMTHNNVVKEVRDKMGIVDGMIRFSAGLENKEDLIADFEQALSTL